MNRKNTKSRVVIAVMLVITTANLYSIYNNHQLFFLLFLIPSMLTISLLTWHFKWFKLNEHNLFNQPLFIISILLPLYYSFMFGLWVWKDQHISLSPSGYLNFITESKLPLLILALSVPLASIINNIHRTIQTEKQIYESEKKNNFDISINHIKYHTELFQKIEVKEITENYKIKASKGDEYIEKEARFTPIVLYPSSLYKKLFISNNNNEKYTLKTNVQFLKKIKNDWNYLNFCFKKMNRYNSFLHQTDNKGSFRAVKCKIYFEMCNAYETLCNTLELGNYRPEVSFCSEDKDDTYQIWIPFYNQNTLYRSIKTIEELSFKVFDIIKDENVESYFPANEKLFIYGPGVIDDWSYFMSDRILMDETQSRISASSRSFNFVQPMAALQRQSTKKT